MMHQKCQLALPSTVLTIQMSATAGSVVRQLWKGVDQRLAYSRKFCVKEA